MFGFLGLLGLLAAVGAWLVSVYNRLVRLKVRCEDAWASIDVQLKRRYDLIPNLVETVKAYASHERETFEAVVEARQAGIDAGTVEEQAQAENMISGALRQLFALSEAYPDLKANKNFLELQENLTEIEDQIQLARRYYNGTARNYNIRVQSFPSLIIAKLFKFEPADYFEIEFATESSAPEVKLS